MTTHTRNQMRKKWIKSINDERSTADDWEVLRKELHSEAGTYGWEDWRRYFEARKEYAICEWDKAEKRLQKFVKWARKNKEKVGSWLFANGIFCLAYSLISQNKNRQALLLYDENLERFSKEEDKDVQLVLARGITCAVNISESNEAKKGYLEILLALYKKYDTAEIRLELAKSIVNFVGSCTDVINIDPFLNELRRLVAKHNEPQVRLELANALFNANTNEGGERAQKRGFKYLNELRDLAKKHDAAEIWGVLAEAIVGLVADEENPVGIKAYLDELRTLAQKHGDAEIRQELAKGLYNAFNNANQAKKWQDASALLDELRALHDEYDESGIRYELAKSLYNKGIILYQKGKKKQAFEDLRQVVSFIESDLNDQTSNFYAKAEFLYSVIRNEMEDVEGSEAVRGVSKDVFEDNVAQLGSDEKENLQRSILRKRLLAVIGQFKPEKNRFIDRMQIRKLRIERFLAKKTLFDPTSSVLLVLRQWNSFTPIIADGQESDRGGGYFIYHKGLGLVIDPGYDFIEHFHHAGGKIHDITHVAVTHAHDDHTAQLEQLLTMFHQYNSLHGKQEKQVVLLLNHSTMKKFSGFRLHRDCSYVKNVVCLNSYDNKNAQVIILDETKNISMTVLPAYHDDVFSTNYAVGIGIQFDFGNDVRRILFTGDTGLFPPKLSADGKVVKFESGPYKGEKKVCEDQPELAVHKNYPHPFDSEPHLLIPHIGSIKKYEFDPEIDEDIPMFYPNHLGLLGTATLINELSPKAVILSEFGSELKDFRMVIARLLSKAMCNNGKNSPFIIPGDVSIVYNIRNGTFLCHEDCSFKSQADLEAKEADHGAIGLFKHDGLYTSLERYHSILRRLRGENVEEECAYTLAHMRDAE